MRRIPLGCFLVLASAIWAGHADAAGKKFHWTYPMPPRAKPTDPMAITLARHLPEHMDSYTWKAVAASHEKGATEVRAYTFGSDGLPVPGGTLPVASSLTFATFRFFGGQYYYGIVWPLGSQPAPGSRPALAWIKGANIAPATYKPIDQ